MSSKPSDPTSTKTTHIDLDSLVDVYRGCYWKIIESLDSNQELTLSVRLTNNDYKTFLSLLNASDELDAQSTKTTY